MKGTLAALLVAVFALPALAQLTELSKAAEKIAGQKLGEAPASQAGRAVAQAAPVPVTRAELLETQVMKQLLAGDYEVNAEVDSGLSEELKKTFVLISVKPGILKKFSERHYMSTPSGKIVGMPIVKQDDKLDKNVRADGEVRAVAGKYLAVRSLDSSLGYFDLGDADETRPSIYDPAGSVNAGDIRGLDDAALADDALAAAGFDAAALKAAKDNLMTVSIKRGNPTQYLIQGSKKSRLGFSTAGHTDFFWPTIVLN